MTDENASKTYKIAAFGALNQGSYDSFKKWLGLYADDRGIEVELHCAGPYPNAEAVTKPGRPLRGDALKDSDLKKELFAAVAADARALGKDFDGYCMPCLSMVGFHDGVQDHLGHPIIRMDKAIKKYYEPFDKIGVIHMTPATKRIEEIFGAKAVRPPEALQKKLIEAEQQVKSAGDSTAVENVMREITGAFQQEGLSHVFYARADAPLAQDHIEQDAYPDIVINSYFEILAREVVNTLHPIKLAA